MKLSEELKWRGLIGQTTIADLSDLDEPGKTFYFGADPSADSMTIGNLAAMILCIRFLRAGHKGIILAGGATGMAGGDPDGKDEARAKIDEATLENRISAFRRQFQWIFRDYDVHIVNNYDWFKDINYIDFLRNIGWNFSMTQLLDRDFVKKRIGPGGKGLNYAEFSYSLIQGYDFLHLYREYGVTIQLCGVDQFGNSVSGMQLTRKLENAKVDIVGMPLIINKSTGKKFGKSESGAIWLDSAKTSVYKFYQFWLNVDDAGVTDYLKVYTFLSPEEIGSISAEQLSNPSARIAQKCLAEEVTKLVHGDAACESARKVTAVLFGGDSLSNLNDSDIDLLQGEIPTVPISADNTVADILTTSGVAASKAEARRLIKQNAISIDGDKIHDDLIINQLCLIKKGKNQFILVK